MAYLETTNSSVQAVLVSFLDLLTPPNWVIVEGQDNRVPEPPGSYIVVTPVNKERLSTNVVLWADVAFTGSVSTTTLIVTSVRFGSIDVDAQPSLWGVGVLQCNISSQITGSPGGVGTYQLSGTPGQTIPSQQLAAGQLKIMMPTKATYQVDVHSPDVSSSSDVVQLIATTWRDGVSVEFFDASGVRATPLYCEEPRQTPFTNSEQQYETRWTVDVHLQVNAVVDWPYQYLDNVDVTFVALP